MHKFQHYISLGHCCSVAGDLKMLGFREASLPFDWVISNWEAIERSIKTRFDGYLNHNNFYQKKTILNVYRNKEYGVSFYHDFVDYKSLKSQIRKVQKKYQRRINRFFEYIASPTLFIRFCYDYDELVYISENYDEVESMIKQFNDANEIVFISQESPEGIDVSNIKHLFLISKGEDERLINHPVLECKELHDYLLHVDYNKRENNLQFSKNTPEKNRKGIRYRIKRKVIKFQQRKKYIHDKQF